MSEVIWASMDLNPAFIPTFPNNQDDFGNYLSLPNFASINSSFVSDSTYGGEGMNLAFSKHWRQSRCSYI